MTSPSENFEQWAIVELMGHRRLAGLVTEEERFGTKMLRVDIPPTKEGGQKITQYYGGSSIYALTITDEETARTFAEHNIQRPIDEWSARRMLRLDRPDAGDPDIDDDTPWVGE